MDSAIIDSVLGNFRTNAGIESSWFTDYSLATILASYSKGRAYAPKISPEARFGFGALSQSLIVKIDHRIGAALLPRFSGVASCSRAVWLLLCAPCKQISPPRPRVFRRTPLSDSTYRLSWRDAARRTRNTRYVRSRCNSISTIQLSRRSCVVSACYPTR